MYGTGGQVPGGTLFFGSGSVAAPSIAFSAQPQTGFFYGGAAGRIGIANGAGITNVGFSSGGLILDASGRVNWSDTVGAIYPPATIDVSLFRDTAGVLSLKNAANPQAFRLYNTTTGPEYLELVWSGNTAFIQATAVNNRSMSIRTLGAGTLTFAINSTNRWVINTSGNFTGASDNTFSLGETGAGRPSTLFLGTSLQIEANNGFKLTNQVSTAAAQVATLTNGPVAGNPAFWVPIVVNGTTRSFPVW